MTTLDHIEYSSDLLLDGYDMFVTVTLPKTHYRKGARKQSEVMDMLLKKIGNSYAESFVGAMELTVKGNVHAHLIFKCRELFPDIKFKDNAARLRAHVTMLSSCLKHYSICDVQIIKNMSNVDKYVRKDVDITSKIIGRNAYIRFNTIRGNPLELKEDVNCILELEQLDYKKCSLIC